MPVTTTLTPSPSPVPSTTPVAAQTVVPSHADAAQVTLISQLQHVDPLLWTALAGVLVVPFLHQVIKRFATFLHDPRHRTTNYLIAGLLSLLVGVLTDLQNSGALSRLHNPALATILSAALSYTLGQQVYGYFVKTNEQLKQADVVDNSLPVDLNP